MTDIVIATNSGETSTLPEAPEAKAKQLPEPSGYHMLVCIPESEDKYDSGLVKADQTKHVEEVLSTVFFVIKLGVMSITLLHKLFWCLAQ